MTQKKVSIIGSGSWGSALASVLSYNGYRVAIWSRNRQVIDDINFNNKNSKYLPNIKLGKNVYALSDLSEVLANSSLVLIVVPSHVMREIAKEVANYIPENTLLVHATKGFEVTEKNDGNTNVLRMSEVIEQELPSTFKSKVTVLSGPSHAEEVALRLPTTIVLASSSNEIAAKIQKFFSNDYFRVYTNEDVIGVELGGSLKNIIALAAGISDGLKFGDNTKAALVTRGLAEITRMGLKILRTSRCRGLVCYLF
jgi:glycerol-3-phosphate dehydrogenase (NAD(P)+)